MINKLWQIVNIYLENRWFWKKKHFDPCFFFNSVFFFFKKKHVKKKTEHVLFQENTNWSFIKFLIHTFRFFKIILSTYLISFSYAFDPSILLIDINCCLVMHYHFPFDLHYMHLKYRQQLYILFVQFFHNSGWKSMQILF